MESMPDDVVSVGALRQLLVGEIVDLIGLPAAGWAHRLVELLFWMPTLRLAEIGARFDRYVAELGYGEAARQILPAFVSDHRTRGADSIPREGPLIVAANHPGTCDVIAISAGVHRDDLKVVCQDIAFLRALTSAAQNMIFTSHDKSVRTNVLRAAVRHLEKGGAVLVFASGHMDPDPEVLPGAYDELGDWLPSLDWMMRRVPDTQLVVTIASGVLARTCAHNPLVRIRNDVYAQRALGELIQMAQQLGFGRKFPLTAKISFAEPMARADLCASCDPPDVTAAIVQRARHLLSDHLTAYQVGVMP